jgi:hypothetical protein
MVCDFTLEHYKECLESAMDKGYRIGPVCDYEKLGDKYILLRHDVDFCLDYAYEMAMVDADMDISSTFYVMLQSTTYNALSPNNMELLRLIDDYEHEIGWHIDSRHSLALEYSLLESITGQKVKSFARHYMTLTPPTEQPLLIDAMDWKRLGVKYISESSRNWREGCMCNWIGKKDKLEILTHPIWWVTDSKSRWEAIDKLYDNLVFDVMVSVDEYRDIVKNYLRELGVNPNDDRIQPNRILETSRQNILS